MCNISIYPGFPFHATIHVSLSHLPHAFSLLSCTSLWCLVTLSFLYIFSSLHSSFSFLFTKFPQNTISCAFLFYFSRSKLGFFPQLFFPNFASRRKNKIIIFALEWHSSLNEKGYFCSWWCLVINKEFALQIFVNSLVK